MGVMCTYDVFLRIMIAVGDERLGTLKVYVRRVPTQSAWTRWTGARRGGQNSGSSKPLADGILAGVSRRR